MKILNTISENEMVAIFLKAEVDSPRWGKKVHDVLYSLGKSPSLLRTPNLKSDIENLVRKKILSLYRGYGTDTLLFKSFPKNIGWKRALIDVNDLSAIHYINYDEDWKNISGGTRRVIDAIKKFRSGKAHNDRLTAFAEKIRNGETFPEVILVGKTEEKLVILEGHARLTAYALALENTASIPDELEIIIGTSPEIDKWVFF